MKIDNEIIEKAKNGDSEAISEIYSLTYEKIYKYLLKKSKSKEIAEDITQETYRIAIEKLNTLKRNESIMPWLYMTAGNVYKQHLRKQKNISDENTNLDNIIDKKSSTEENQISDDTEKYILKIMKDKLSDAQFKTFMLYAVEDMSYEKISQKLDCPLGTVKSRINKSRKILQAEITSLEKKGISIRSLSGLPLAEKLDITISTAESISHIEMFFKKIFKLLFFILICFTGIQTINVVNEDDDNIIIYEHSEEMVSDTEKHIDVSVEYVSEVTEIRTCLHKEKMV